MVNLSQLHILDKVIILKSDTIMQELCEHYRTADQKFVPCQSSLLI